MKQAVNAGELRTDCAFFSQAWTVNANNIEVLSEENVFGKDAWVRCKWTPGFSNNNMVTSELMLDGTFQLKQPATIVTRFSPKITAQCVVYKKGEALPYEIVSVSDVEDRRAWLEIKVQRKVQAR